MKQHKNHISEQLGKGNKMTKKLHRRSDNQIPEEHVFHHPRVVAELLEARIEIDQVL